MLLYRAQWKKLIKWSFVGVALFFIYNFGKSIFKEEPRSERVLSEIKEKDVQCTLPELPLWSSNEARANAMANSRKHDCSSNPKDWSYILNGSFYIKSQIEKTHGKVTCHYHNVVRSLYDLEVTLTLMQPISNNTPIPSDVIHVKCVAEDGTVNYRTYIGVKPVDEVPNKMIDTKIKFEGLGLNIIMFGFDSVSRLQWKRFLPNSYNWFEKIGGVILEHYNIIGDGTPQALLPILTGYTETDLPEARRGFKKAKYIDSHPWIWNRLHEYGYVTQWGEDSPQYGTFTYRMLGFKEQPVTHYMRPYFLQQNAAKCVGNRLTHQVFIDYLKELFTVYSPNRRKFSFLFHSDYSHDNQNILSTPDDDLVLLMQWLNDTNNLENTLLIFMADHGPRFSETRATELGKYEERLPFMGLRVPQTDAFKAKFPLLHENLKRNAKLLTTPHDIFETFIDVISYRMTQVKHHRPYSRGVSLFQRIPPDRNCNDVRLAAHWCTCLKWYKISTEDQVVQRAAAHVINFINNMTQTHRNVCALLEPHKLTTASFFMSNDALLKFKKSIDNDGRVADMTDGMQPSLKTYQIVFSTLPNLAVYESTIKYHVSTDNFTISPSDISRLNAYKKQPDCIAQAYPHLRPYCYCNQRD